VLHVVRQHVDQVGVGRVGFQAVGDGVVDAGGGGHHVVPLLVAAAVGEERHATAPQRSHLLGRQSAAAAGGEPQLVGMEGGHDEGGLLALDEADVGLAAPCEQVLAVEALVELPVGRQYQEAVSRREIMHYFIAFYVILAFRGSEIEDFCVNLHRS